MTDTIYDPTTNPVLSQPLGKEDSVIKQLSRSGNQLIDFEEQRKLWAGETSSVTFAKGVATSPVIAGEGYQYPLVAVPLHSLQSPTNALELLPLGPSGQGEAFSMYPNSSPSEPINLAQLRRRRDPLALGITPSPDTEEAFAFTEDRRFVMTPSSIAEAEVPPRSAEDVVVERLTGAGLAPVGEKTWQPALAPTNPQNDADPLVPPTTLGARVVPSVAREVAKDPSIASAAKRLEAAKDATLAKFKERTKNEEGKK